MKAPDTHLERLEAYFERGEGCWIWNGHLARGYGRFGIGGKQWPAHRVVYETYVGPIPDGLQIDHLCRVSACVNPAHLEPVTQAENIRRGLRGRMVTHCPAGHPYDDVNTYVRPGGRRKCRACNTDRERRKRVAERESRVAAS